MVSELVEVLCAGPLHFLTTFILLRLLLGVLKGRESPTFESKERYRTDFSWSSRIEVVRSPEQQGIRLHLGAVPCRVGLGSRVPKNRGSQPHHRFCASGVTWGQPSASRACVARGNKCHSSVTLRSHGDKFMCRSSLQYHHPSPSCPRFLP